MFFDNIQVLQKRGAILEETDYYPFGLVMSGISSKAAGTIQNKEKTFQGQRFDDDLGLNWVQFKWRNHDPQIGRFIEIDPLSEKYVYNSTYAFSENKVTAHVELEGLESVGISDIQNPFVKAFLSPNVTKPLTKMAENVSEAASVKVGVVAGGFGFRGKLGPADVKIGASGPKASTTITLGGNVSAEGSVATVGAEGKVGNIKIGSAASFGLLKYEDGKVTSALSSLGAVGSASKENSGVKREISSSGEISIGGTIGFVSLDANANPVKAANASTGFFEALGNYVKEVIKELTPTQWGGNKDVKSP